MTGTSRRRRMVSWLGRLRWRLTCTRERYRWFLRSESSTSGRASSLRRSPVIVELQGDLEVHLAEGVDHPLESVLILRDHPKLVALDAGLHLGVLAPDLLGQGARQLLGDPPAELDHLALVALGRRLGLLGVQHLEVDAAPVELALEDVEDGFELHVALGEEDQLLLLQGDLHRDALEVVPGLDLPACLVDSVDHLLVVEVADDVERGLPYPSPSSASNSSTWRTSIRTSRDLLPSKGPTTRCSASWSTSRAARV